MRGLGGEQTTGIRINVFESFLQMHGGRTIEFVQYFVMRSLGQSHVEIDIGRDTVVQSSAAAAAPRRARCVPIFSISACVRRCAALRQWRPPESAGPPPDRRCRHVACTAPSTRSVPSGFRRTSRPPAALSATPCWPRSSRLRAPSTADPENFHQFGFGRQLPADLEPSLRDLLLQPDGHLFGQRSFSNRRIRTLYHHII